MDKAVSITTSKLNMERVQMNTSPENFHSINVYSNSIHDSRNHIFNFGNISSTTSHLPPEDHLLHKVSKCGSKQQEFVNSQPSSDIGNSKFGLPRQKSFDQGGEGKLSSSQVKQKLKECVLNKKINKLNKSPLTGPSPQNSFESEENQNINNSNEQSAAVASSYVLPGNESTNCTQDDFPIRKTSSLPNLKVRSALKQKAIDRRPSPLSKRRSKMSSVERNSNNPNINDNGSISINNHNNNISNNATGAGIKLFGQKHVITNENLTNQNNVKSMNTQFSSSKLNFGKYPQNIFDNENNPAAISQHLLSSLQLKPTNPGNNVDLLHQSLPSYQLPLQALLNTQVLLRQPFVSLPNLSLAHSLTALLSANNSNNHTLDFSNPALSNGQLCSDRKDLDSTSIDVNMDTTSFPNSNAFGVANASRSLSHGFSPRKICTSNNSMSYKKGTRVLNRTNSAPLPLGTTGNSASSALQLAMQEQKELVKAHIRQKVLSRSSNGQQSGHNIDDQMIIDKDPCFDLKNICVRTFSDSLISGNDRIPQRSLSLDDSSSETEQIQSAPFSPDLRSNVAFQYRMVSNPSTVGGYNIQTSNSGSINKLPSPILEEKILEHPHNTAIIYDVGMLSHRCLCGNEDIHPESSRRLSLVIERLKETQIDLRCHVITNSKKASMDDLQLCHEDTYSVLFGTNPANRLKINPQLLMSVEFCRLPCGGIGVDSDTIWNNIHTANAARLAVGCVVELTLKVVRGELKNGFALVRPPGHHAEYSQAMGFGYFNSVAIAAKKVTSQTAVKRVLIIDWDIHHGNGTQQIFYTDPSILYISIHRHDNGHFFPGTGLIEEIGDGAGSHYNINIAWKSSTDGSFTSMSDAEYMSAFSRIVLPVAKEFSPDLILVSAGFDATKPHPQNLGGYSVSPACYGWMTKQLTESGLAEGRVLLALEGGYDITSLCDCVEVCMWSLIKPEMLNFTDCNQKSLKSSDGKFLISQAELNRVPQTLAVDTLFAVAQTHKNKWQCLRNLTKDNLTVSYNNWLKIRTGNKVDENIPLLAMAGLTVQHQNKPKEMDYDVTPVGPDFSEPMEEGSNM